MINTFPLTKARINLGALIKRVHRDKEYIVLEKDGIPVAGLMDIDEFDDYLELKNPVVQAHIRKSNTEYLAGKTKPADVLLHSMVRDRPKNSYGNRRRKS